jgi:hypothetical protein
VTGSDPHGGNADSAQEPSGRPRHPKTYAALTIQTTCRVATILLAAGMPLDHVQKFLLHMRIASTQTYAETSLGGLGATYL